MDTLICPVCDKDSGIEENDCTLEDDERLTCGSCGAKVEYVYDFPPFGYETSHLVKKDITKS